MGALFSKPEAPPPPPPPPMAPPPPPSLPMGMTDNASIRRKGAAASGYAATNATGPQGLVPPPGLAQRSLLG